MAVRTCCPNIFLFLADSALPVDGMVRAWVLYVLENARAVACDGWRALLAAEGMRGAAACLPRAALCAPRGQAKSSARSSLWHGGH